MIFMSINTHDYENDVRVMTGAFYPGEKIIIDENRISECIGSVKISVVENYITGSIDFGTEYKIDVTCDQQDKKSIRNLLKREMYHIFEKITGKELPWGTLTGIRPTKIPYGLIEQGFSDEVIRDNLKKEYLMSDSKVMLSMDVAHNEFNLLKNVDYDNGYSLYVGIPFCPTTCLYCSFTSYPLSMWRTRVDEYLDALIKELDFLSKRLAGRKATSVYIGGGTPTTLTPTQLTRLITFIKEHFDVSGLLEFTVEGGRPDSIDRDKLMALRSLGIDRISINPQTMNQVTLDLIGRRHTVEEVKKAFALARECGFTNINMDMIIGLPGETAEDVRHTLEEIEKLSPDSLTVHSLAIKRAARLNIFKEEYKDYKIENTDEIIDMTQDFARGMGMSPYYLYRQKNMAGNFENVGYARQGCFGIYNILIMEERQSIFAAGANAQTKIVYNNPKKVDRIEAVKDVKDYIERVDEMIDRKRKYFDANGI